MSVLDIRAKVYCSLGPVISGSVSDSYIQGEGLIYTRGTVIVDGIRQVSVGAELGLAYLKNNMMIKLPRKLFVLSSFADPFRRQTTVSLGCYLTLLSESSFGETILKAAETKPDVPCAVFNTINLGMEAADIAQAIMDKLSIVGDASILKNHFSIDEFVIPSKPLSVLSDLLVSENFVGSYHGGFLDLRSNEPKKGPRFYTSQIIDVGPINSGAVPGDKVVVKYSTVKLGEPPESESDEDRAKRNWEWEEVFGFLQEVSISYYDEEATVPTEVVRRAYYMPYSFSATTYDIFDRAVMRFNYELSVLGETNNRYATDLVRYGSSGIGGGFDKFLITETPKVSFTKWEYKIPAVGGTSGSDLYQAFLAGGIAAVKNAAKEQEDPEKTALECLLEKEGIDPADLSEVLSERTVSFITEAELAGTLNIDSYSYVVSPFTNTRTSISLQTICNIIDSITVVAYEKDKSSGITKTKTTQQLVYAKTTTGQQDLATLLKTAQENEDPDEISVWIEPILTKAQTRRNIGTELRIRTEREYGLQKRPSQADRNSSYYGKALITGSPETVQEFTGSYGKGTVEFQLPYADDDRISWSSATGFTTVSNSKAQDRAAEFGKIQNWILYANRYGVSITIPADLMSSEPYAPLTIVPDTANFGVNYMTNGTTYTFDSNGIVASSDLLGFGVPF